MKKIVVLFVSLLLLNNLFSQPKELKQLEKGNIEKALKYCDKYEGDSDKDNCYKSVADYCLKNKKPKEALKYYQMTSEKNIDKVVNYYFTNKNNTEAEKLLREYKLEKFYYKLANSYFKSQNYDKTFQVIGELKTNATGKFYHQLSKHYIKENNIEKVKEIANSKAYIEYCNTNKKNKYNRLYADIAQHYYRKEQYDSALQYNFNGSGTSYIPELIFTSLSKKSDFEKMGKLIKKYDNIKTVYPFGYGRYCFKMKNYDEAEKYFSIYLKDKKKNSNYSQLDTLFILAKTLVKLNKDSLALNWMSYKPTDKEYLIELFKYYMDKVQTSNAHKVELLNRKHSPMIANLKDGNITSVCNFWEKHPLSTFKDYAYKWRISNTSNIIGGFIVKRNKPIMDSLKKHIDILSLLDKYNLDKIAKTKNDTTISFAAKYIGFESIGKKYYEEVGMQKFNQFAKTNPQHLTSALRIAINKDYDNALELLNLSNKEEDKTIFLNYFVNRLAKAYSADGKETAVKKIKEWIPKIDFKNVNPTGVIESAFRQDDPELLNQLTAQGVDLTNGVNLDSLYHCLIYSRKLIPIYKQYPAYNEVSDKFTKEYSVPESMQDWKYKITAKQKELLSNSDFDASKLSYNNKSYLAIIEGYSALASILDLYIVTGLNQNSLPKKYNRAYFDFLSRVSGRRLYKKNPPYPSSNYYKKLQALILCTNVFDIAKQKKIQFNMQYWLQVNMALNTIFKSNGVINTKHISNSDFPFLKYSSQQAQDLLKKIK